MVVKAVLSALLILSEVSCAAHRPRAVFDVACETLERMPIGTEIREIEINLSLPAPTKTYVGSSLYPHRTFRYLREDGLFLEIGLFQSEDGAEYPEGRFFYLGHHTVSAGNGIWKRWVYTDGPIEFRGERRDE